MKKGIAIIFFVVLILSCWGGYWFLHQDVSQCDFFRDGHCLMCDSKVPFLVGYKENCERCANRSAEYIEDGVVPSWLCRIQSGKSVGSLKPLIKRGNKKCPKERPLKDVVGNCYSCNVEDIVRVGSDGSEVCGLQRYVLPDGLLEKSVKCPPISEITDGEVCVMCGGVVKGKMCENEGQNRFCKKNSDCKDTEWCYPLRNNDKMQGVCAAMPETKWICSQTDGYDLIKTKEFCERLGAHIPSLEEIARADEDLSVLCPTLDMWTFFSEDGVVWLESFTQEFLFTREGEVEKMGGHQFYALCHKD